MLLDQQIAIVGKIETTFFADRDGTRIYLKEGDAVYSTDVLSTEGGSAEIIFKDSSTHIFEADTSLNLASLGLGANFSQASPREGELPIDVNESTLSGQTFEDRFGNNDSVTVTKTVTNSNILLGAGNDYVSIGGAATTTHIDMGTGEDTFFVGSMGTGSTLTYDADGYDSITIKGVYNDGMATTTNINDEGDSFAGLATGDTVDETSNKVEGGVINLETWGTGNLQFGAGNDALIITKAINGVAGLKDIFTEGGDDIIYLNTVNGAKIHGGEGADFITAMGLGATGQLLGESDSDTLQIGSQYFADADIRTTATMNTGLIDGGEGNDNIIIGNTSIAGDLIKGTLSGGKVYGGAGNDIITTTTLSGSALIDGGEGADNISLTTMTGGTIMGGENAALEEGAHENTGADSITITTMSGGKIDGGEGLDFVNITTMTNGTITAGADSITIDTMKGGILDGRDADGATEKADIAITTMSGGTIYADSDKLDIKSMSGGSLHLHGSDTVYVNELSGRGVINGSDGNDSLNLVIIQGGTIHGNDGDDSFTIINRTIGGTVNGGDGNDVISLNQTMIGGIINGNDGDDNITLTNMSGGTINGGNGDDSISVNNGPFSGGTINAGEGNNRITISHLLNDTDPKTSTTSTILAGKGDDTLVLNKSVQLGDKYSINLGAGTNEIQVHGDFGGEKTLTLGATHDHVKLMGDAEAAADENVEEAAASAKVNLGTGNDVFDNTALTDAFTGKLTFDNRGQDTIKLDNYKHGIVVDAKGETVDLSFGTDGGTIELGTWSGGAINFGNGNDNFTLGSNLSAKVASGNGNDTITIKGDVLYNEGQQGIDLGTGNDSLFVHSIVTSDPDGHTGPTEEHQWKGIAYDDRGQDSIVITGEYKGDVYITNKGEYNLTTGSDGGYIQVGSWVGGTINGGSGNDTIEILSDLDKTLIVGKGTDSIQVDSVVNAGRLEYDTAGADTISINGTYHGKGVFANGVEKLSTGVDGGTIEVLSLTAEGVDKLEFSDKNDHFSISHLNIAAEKTIDLDKGVDSITVGSFGGDTPNQTTITYDNVGYDSITIESSYDGKSVLAQDDKLSTGNDGGSIHIGSFTDAAAASMLEFGNGVDRFSVNEMIVDAYINLGGGNDYFSVFKTMNKGHINLGSGNNFVYNEGGISGGIITASSGNDTVDITTLSGTVQAGSGHNKLNVDNIGSTGILTAGSGNDSITIRDLHGGVFAADGNNTITVTELLSEDGHILSGIGADKITVDGLDGTVRMGNGNNILTATDVTSYGKIYGGDHVDRLLIGEFEGIIHTGLGNDSISIENVIGGQIHAGLGNDIFTVQKFDGIEINNGDESVITTLNGDSGADNFRITEMNSGAIHAGKDNDSLTITTMEGGTANGEEGNDRLTTTTMNGGTLSGGDGNDTITITTMNGGEVEGNVGNDVINVTMATGGNIYGDNSSSITYGHDTISVKNAQNLDVRAGYGNDRVTISTAEKSTITGGEGNDTLTITTMNGGEVAGNDSRDVLTVVTAINCTVDGDSGLDTLTVTTAIDSLVDGGDQHDKITVTTANRSTVTGGYNGNDSITISHAYDSNIDGDEDNDSIRVTNSYDATNIDGGEGQDSITVTNSIDSTVSGGTGDDSITITTATRSTVNGDGADDGGADSIKITNATESNINGGTGDDSLTITTVTNTTINGGDGDDSISITTLNTGNTITLGAGNDTLYIGANRSGQSDTDLANIVTKDAHADTLSVNWAFNGEFNTQAAEGETAQGDTLITKGLGANAVLDFGAGNDGLIINGTLSRNLSETNASNYLHLDLGAGNDYLHVSAKTSAVDDTALANALGTGQDTLSVGWAFNGKLDMGADGGTLITKGLGTNAELNFGAGSDGLISTAAINATAAAYKEFITGAGDDTIELLSAKHVFIDSGDANDSITIKGTLSNSEIYSGAGDDNVTIKGTLSNSAIFTDTGSDNVTIGGTASYCRINLGDGADTFTVGSMGAGASLYYETAGADSITIKGVYNDGMVFTESGNGLSTGSDGGSITLDTWGTGTLAFGDGADSLTITKAINGVAGLKDISTGADDDSITLNTVNGAYIQGGEGDDFISATGLGATGVLLGEKGKDTIHIGTEYATVTMNTGLINGGEGADSIIIGNSNTENVTVKGTLSGGQVLGGAGDDIIVTGTLSGAGFIDGGEGADIVRINTMSGGKIDGDTDTLHINTMNGGTITTDNDTVSITTMNGGTIHAQEGDDSIRISTMSGGTVHMGGADTVSISTLSSRGIIHGSDANDTITIIIMNGGTVNGNAGADSIEVDSEMTGGIINAGDGEGADTVTIATLRNGTVNLGEGNDSASITTMLGGTVNGEEGHDNISIDTLGGGTINGGDGDDSIIISEELTGGRILGGTGNDTLVLDSSIQLGTGYSIDLGTGDNEIQVHSSLEHQSLTLGAVHDNVTFTTNLQDARVNTGSGNDTISIENGASFSRIDAGAGNNVITVGRNEVSPDPDAGQEGQEATTVTGTQILGGTGHDEITINGNFTGQSSVNALSGNDTITVTGTLTDATLAYDNRGQDSITLKDYSEGMIVDAAGNSTALSTGTDGGSITLESWTSGDITFGNGHDAFTLNGDLTKDINLGLGNDTIHISGEVTGTITLDNRGQDSIKLSTYDGTNFANLSTGSDGGIIELGTWTEGDITFGNGHDGFFLHDSSGLDKVINLGLGNDSIAIAGVAENEEGEKLGSVTYDARGNDEIYIFGDYDGGFHDLQDGADGVDKLTTGDDGGYIEIGSWTGGKLSGGGGNDTIVVNSTLGANNDLDVGSGNDNITIKGVSGGSLTYSSIGQDSITITGSYDGTGIFDDSNKNAAPREVLTTGNDGGYIEVDSLENAKAAEALEFGNGADHFVIHGMTMDAAINLGSGNDTFTLGYPKAVYAGNMIAGSIDLGAGNDKAQMGTLAGGAVYGDAGNDTFTVNSMNGGTLYGDDLDGKITGHDSIVVESLSGNDTISGIIHAGNGNDKIFITTAFAASQTHAGNGNDSITVNSLGGTALVKGNDGYDTITITAMHGNPDGGGTVEGGAHNDRITVQSTTGGTIMGEEGNDTIHITNASGVVIWGDNAFDLSNPNADLGNGADSINITTANDVDVYAGAGNDKIIMGEVSNKSTVYAGDGNDSLTITTLNQSTLDGGSGNDTITITTAENASAIRGDAGTDRITVKEEIQGSTISGGSENDIIHVTSANSSTINGDEHNDSITVITADSTTINGGAGLDLINVTTATKGKIHGGADADKITVKTLHGVLEYDEHNQVIPDSYAQVTGDSGNDTITVTTSTGGQILGGADNDTILVTNARESIIDGEDGADKLTVTSATSSTIDGGAGKDSITSTTLNQSSIDGGADDDTITVTHVYSNTTVAGGTGNDTIKVTNVHTDSLIGGDEGDDSITVTTVTQGHIEGDTGHDTIFVSNLVNGFVSGDDGNDNIRVNNLGADAAIEGGAGDDTITVTAKNANNNLITGGDGADKFIINSSTGELYLQDFNNDAGDTLIINGRDYTADMKKAVESGKSSFTVGGLTVNFDNDFFSEINNVDDVVISNITYTDSIEGDVKATLYNFNGGINGATVTLSGAEGFMVGSKNDDLTMENATLTASAGADSIHVHTLNSSTLTGGAGNDVIMVDIATGVRQDAFEATPEHIVYSKISGDSGDDRITVGVADKAEVKGGDGDDVITIEQLYKYNAIEGGQGNDTINLSFTNADHSTVLGGAGADVFNITKSTGAIFLQDFTDGDRVTVDGKDITDLITAAQAKGQNSVTSGRVEVHFESLPVSEVITVSKVTLAEGTPPEGKTFTNTSDGHIVLNITDGIDGGEKITLKQGEGYSGGFILGSTDDDGTFQMRGGEIIGSAGDDIFRIDDMHNGTLNAGAGNDTIIITEDLGDANPYGTATLTGGDGNDVFQFTSTSGNIYVKDFSKGDNLFVGKTKLTQTILDAQLEGKTSIKHGNLTINFDNEIFGGTVTQTNKITEEITINDINPNDGKFTLVNLNGHIGTDGEVLLVGTDGFVVNNDAKNLTITEGELRGSEGSDTITVHTATRAEIEGDYNPTAGAESHDVIRVTNLNDAVITAGIGNDSVTVTNFNQYSEIYGGEGEDTITFTVKGNHNNNVYGGLDNDTFHISGSGSVNMRDFKAGDELWVGTTNLTQAILDAQNEGKGFYKHGSLTINFSDTPVTETIVEMENVFSEKPYANNSEGYKELILNDGIGYFGTVNLTGAGGFIVNGTDKGGAFDLEGTLNGSEGADSITIHDISGALHAGDGNDTITVTSDFMYGIINGDAGNDSITVNDFSGVSSAIDGGAGDDIITVTLDEGAPGTILGGEGADTFHINDTSDSVFMGDFNSDKGDKLYVNGKDYTTNMTDAFNKGEISITVGGLTVNFESIYGRIVTENRVETEEISNGTEIRYNNDGPGPKGLILQEGINYGQTPEPGTVTLTGTGGFVVVGTEDGGTFKMKGGVLMAGQGADIIKIEEMHNGIVSGNVGNDSISVSEDFKGGRIMGDEGDDQITVNNFNSDNTNAHEFILDGGEGNDTITVTLDGGKQGTILGGEGDDVIHINATTGSVKITDFSQGDALFINGTESTQYVHDAQDSGQDSYSYDGITIYFA